MGAASVASENGRGADVWGGHGVTEESKGVLRTAWDIWSAGAMVHTWGLGPTATVSDYVSLSSVAFS